MTKKSIEAPKAAKRRNRKLRLGFLLKRIEKRKKLYKSLPKKTLRVMEKARSSKEGYLKDVPFFILRELWRAVTHYLAERKEASQKQGAIAGRVYDPYTGNWKRAAGSGEQGGQTKCDKEARWIAEHILRPLDEVLGKQFWSNPKFVPFHDLIETMLAIARKHESIEEAIAEMHVELAPLLKKAALVMWKNLPFKYTRSKRTGKLLTLPTTGDRFKNAIETKQVQLHLIEESLWKALRELKPETVLTMAGCLFIDRLRKELKDDFTSHPIRFTDDHTGNGAEDGPEVSVHVGGAYDPYDEMRKLVECLKSFLT